MLAPVSVWLSCALISCTFYRRASAQCSQQTDCFEQEICCNGRCVPGASCGRGSCSTDEHCDTLQGERCEQGRCTSKEALTTAATLRCKNVQDCGTHYNASCCNGLCTQEPSCIERCSNDEQCDTTKGERCIRNRCVAGMNVACRDDFDCRAGKTCAQSRQCVDKEFDKGSLWSKEKITGIVVFVVVGIAVTVIYAMCKKSRWRSRRSSTSQEQPAGATGTTAEFVVIDMERPVPFSPDAPPSYDSLTFSSNQRNQEQEPAPPPYDEAVRNSTNNLA